MLGFKKTNWKIKNGCLIFDNEIENIVDGAFSNNRLMCVKIPSSVVSVGNFSFIGNDLIELYLEDGLVSIGENAFSFNELKSVVIPSSVRTIGQFSFSNNRLVNVILNEGVIDIGDYAFSGNYLTSIVVPTSVKHIGKNAFTNTDVIYDGIQIKKEYLNKYGTENIIKLVNLFKVADQNVIYKFPREVIEEVPPDTESVKGFERNYKLYDKIKLDLNTEMKNIEYNGVFKLCYILGLFKNGNEKLIILIENILNTFTTNEINKSFENVRLTNYKSGVKNLVIKLFLENELRFENQIIIGRIYNVYEKIKEYTIKRHALFVSRKIKELKKLEKQDIDTDELKLEIKKLKENIKTISYDDLVYYFHNNKLDIRKGNEALNKISDELAVYVDQKGFDELQDLYEESQGVLKSIPITKDINNSDVTYCWAKSNDPINIILGYIFNSCIKIGDVGEDIMRQSLINKDVANLIIYDEGKNVIGKATAYYNQNKRYILFNTASVKKVKTKNLEKERRIKCLKAILRATYDVVGELKKQDICIKDIRIGMTRNDLSEIINKSNLNIELENLLPNYNYKGYEGDANGLEGQAILYSDKDDLDTDKAHFMHKNHS